MAIMKSVMGLPEVTAKPTADDRVRVNQEEQKGHDDTAGPPDIQITNKIMANSNHATVRLPEGREKQSEDSMMRLNPTTDVPGSYQFYMRQLSDDELSLLYTAYYYDFVTFGYDPLEDL